MMFGAHQDQGLVPCGEQSVVKVFVIEVEHCKEAPASFQVCFRYEPTARKCREKL